MCNSHCNHFWYLGHCSAAPARKSKKRKEKNTTVWRNKKIRVHSTLVTDTSIWGLTCWNFIFFNTYKEEKEQFQHFDFNPDMFIECYSYLLSQFWFCIQRLSVWFCNPKKVWGFTGNCFFSRFPACFSLKSTRVFVSYRQNLCFILMGLCVSLPFLTFVFSSVSLSLSLLIHLLLYALVTTPSMSVFVLFSNSWGYSLSLSLSLSSSWCCVCY